MVDDSDKISAMMQGKVDTSLIITKNTSLKQVLDNYIATIDAAITATDAAIQAVVSARAAVNADSTVNANIKAELRALESACLALRDENRNYRTAFVYIRDNYCS